MRWALPASWATRSDGLSLSPRRPRLGLSRRCAGWTALAPGGIRSRRRAGSVRYPMPEERSCPSYCSMPPAAVAHPPPCRSSTPAGRRATKEIVTVMRHAGDGVHGRRLRGLIVVLWRAGLRICEALALAEADLDPRRGSLLVRRGKGGRRREVGMDD